MRETTGVIFGGHGGYDGALWIIGWSERKYLHEYQPVHSGGANRRASRKVDEFSQDADDC